MAKQISLSDDDWDMLLLTLGLAAGGADRNGNRQLARRILQLANAVNQGNPNWEPYVFKEDSNAKKENV